MASAPISPPPPSDTKTKKSSHTGLWFTFFLVLAVGGWFVYRHFTAKNSAAADGSGGSTSGGKSAGGKKGGAGGRGGATPVSVATATKGNISVYVTGLGTVTAFNTVTVRTRVDGELINVAFREGQLVHQGDLLAEIDPRPYQVQLTQAEGTMARDQATLANARVDLQRYQVLVQQGAVTQQQVDTQAATVRQNEGVVTSDQGAIDSAKLNLTYTHIRSPITGRIGLRAVDRGNLVHAADANGLATVTQIQPIAIIFSMPEDNLPVVQRQLRAQRSLVAEAWDRDLTNKLATGSLLTLDNQIDQTTGTVKVKLQFSNQENTLFPNQFVNVKLLVDTKRNVTIVPTTAIQRSTQGTFVYVVKQPGNKAMMQNVTTGPSEKDMVMVQSGVNPGDVLITEGVDRLQPGGTVIPHAPGQGGRQHSNANGEDVEGTQGGGSMPNGAKPAGMKPEGQSKRGVAMEGGNQPQGTRQDGSRQ